MVVLSCLVLSCRRNVLSCLAGFFSCLVLSVVLLSSGGLRLRPASQQQSGWRLAVGRTIWRGCRPCSSAPPGSAGHLRLQAERERERERDSISVGRTAIVFAKTGSGQTRKRNTREGKSATTKREGQDKRKQKREPTERGGQLVPGRADDVVAEVHLQVRAERNGRFWLSCCFVSFCFLLSLRLNHNKKKSSKNEKKTKRNRTRETEQEKRSAFLLLSSFCLSP
eukprot:COSAG06_NODE_5641_length_3344_cov_22.891834_4_plen_224_part_00